MKDKGLADTLFNVAVAGIFIYAALTTDVISVIRSELGLNDGPNAQATAAAPVTARASSETVIHNGVVDVALSKLGAGPDIPAVQRAIAGEQDAYFRREHLEDDLRGIENHHTFFQSTGCRRLGDDFYECGAIVATECKVRQELDPDRWPKMSWERTVIQLVIDRCEDWNRWSRVKRPVSIKLARIRGQWETITD